MIILGGRLVQDASRLPIAHWRLNDPACASRGVSMSGRMLGESHFRLPPRSHAMNASSQQQPVAEPRHVGPADPDTPMTVTLVFHHREPPHVGVAQPMGRQEYASRHGADPDDMQRLRNMATRHGLTEESCNPGRRTMRLRGTARDMREMFGVDPAEYELPSGARFVGTPQQPTLPDPSLIAVLGLDPRPVARPHFRRAQATPTASFTPPQLAVLYAFPPGTDGSGQTIGIIELGGGYQAADLSAYFKALGIVEPTITAVSVDGATNSPGSDADGEVALDIEIAGSLAPGAALAVYFTVNTLDGFYNAISQAAHDTVHKPGVISISWGGPEKNWTTQGRNAMESALQDAAAMGLTVTVACGDSGDTDGQTDGQLHVDYPASSVYSLACGGTRVAVSGGQISSETVWNETAGGNGATGGGVSVEFALPAWQTHSGVPAGPGGFAGRGVPDVSGDADPLTGYQVLLNGQNQVFGGTSAVAPLWAALVVRLNQSLGRQLGDAHVALYAIGSSAFRDVTQGNNGHYTAGPGWDACTGLGSPDGVALLQALGKSGSKNASTAACAAPAAGPEPA